MKLSWDTYSGNGRRNAYIMVAVHGSGYCTSAFHATKLILNNILRIAAVNTVGDALLWLGKVSNVENCDSRYTTVRNRRYLSICPT